MRPLPSGHGGGEVVKMANGEWQMANDRTQNTEQRRRSPILGLRSLLLAFLFLTGLLVGAALAAEGDITFKREGGAGGVPAAVFPHWFHRIRYKCYACHPALFEMKAGANKISMEAIQGGKFCGACHNGKIAWGMTFESCNRCHVGQ